MISKKGYLYDPSQDYIKSYKLNEDCCTDKKELEKVKNISNELKKLEKIEKGITYPTMKYGRIYTPFHNLGKEYRSAIKFRDGEKLIEIADATSAFYAMSAIAYSIDTFTTEATAEANIILNEIDNDIYSQIAQKTNTSRKDIKSKINRIMFMSSRSTKTLLAQLTR